MIIGYARTSTFEQTNGLEAQIAELKSAGCNKIFSEQVSAQSAERPQLEKALDYIREDDADVLVVTKLDRFARSLETAIGLEKRIQAKGASLKILSMGIDTATPTGRLMFNVLGSVAQFDGTYAWVSATKVNETVRDFNNREHPCGYIRNMGPLIIANGQAQYYRAPLDQSLNEGTVGSQGELSMRLVATPARNASWNLPEYITTGRIEGNGTVHARRMDTHCSYDLIWQKNPSVPAGNTQFDGTYAAVSMTQVNEVNGGSGTNPIGQCGNRKPSSLIVTNGQARLPVFEGTVGSRGELAMRAGPSGYERIIKGTIDSNGTARARESTYDRVWQR